MDLSLSQQDLHLLTDLIERELGEASVEARRASTREYRERLHQVRDRLQAILTRLRQAERLGKSSNAEEPERDFSSRSSAEMGDQAYLISVMMGHH